MKFYGQFSPPVDQFIFERYFPDTNIKGTFVECGAFDGLTECSCKLFEEAMGWRGYNLEPVPWIYEQLTQNRPQSTNIPFGLSNTSRQADFSSVDHPIFGQNCTNGSISHVQSHKNILNKMNCVIKTIKVNVITWKELISRFNITHVDLFVLDVEGHEFEVIEGMRDCNVLPDIICIEVGHLDFNLIRENLEVLGYCYDISSHVNAFFIKREKIALFAHRAAADLPKYEKQDHGMSLIEKIDILQQENKKLKHMSEEQSTSYLQKIKALQADNRRVTNHLADLTSMYNNIISSKTWKTAQKIRKLLNRD